MDKVYTQSRQKELVFSKLVVNHPSHKIKLLICTLDLSKTKKVTNLWHSSYSQNKYATQNFFLH
jgi:hypothetical protein